MTLYRSQAALAKLPQAICLRRTISSGPGEDGAPQAGLQPCAGSERSVLAQAAAVTAWVCVESQNALGWPGSSEAI